MHQFMVLSFETHNYPLLRVGEREKVAVMGKMRDTGRMVVKDNRTGEKAMGELPKKTFVDHPVAKMLPEDLRVMQVLDRVLRLLWVGSKRFLLLLWLLWLVTSKVDRWMRDLMARQQCCGPLHLPLSDVAVLAQSPFSTTGCAMAIGEPAGIVELEGCWRWWRWAWRKDLGGVGVSAGCPDISLTVTPDIKHAGRSSLVFVDLSGGHARLGGSAQAQTFKQLGDMKPDCDTALLKRAFPRDPACAGAGDVCLGGDCGCVDGGDDGRNSVME
ncbi:hypothetical protein WA556_004216 [Blastocystis sp. ATCC 50177/Nand II]